MNKVFALLGTWKFWKELIIMTVGMFIGAAAVNYFLVPSHLVIGSISGLSIVLSQLLPIKVSVMIFIINAILLLMAWLLIGKEFGAKTVYTALILGPLMDVWEAIMPSAKLAEMRLASDMPINTANLSSVMGDPLLDLICFVLMLSISQAILFNINASTGGLDIIAKIINKYTHLDIGFSVTVGGAIICCTAFLINPVHLVIIGLVGTWVNGIVVDYFMASINQRKRVCVISEEHERLRDFIVNKLNRGCSLYKVEGGFSKAEHVEIQSLLTKDEFAALLEFIRVEKIEHFITAGNVSEVYGLWHHARHGRNAKA
ncbi:MAG: YitT family protein [Bacteroidales bacterium]|nr:YitT family protein [Bacteroidales bacterium]